MSPLPKLTEIPETLPEDVCLLQGLLRTVVTERDMLRCGMQRLLRERYGTSSERLHEQADVFASAAQSDADVQTGEAPQDAQDAVVVRRRKPGHGRRRPAEHLERERVVHDVPPEERICPACHSERPRIGETVTEQLDYRPAAVIVTQHVTVKYGECKCGCEDSRGVVEATKPFQPIDKGLVGPGLLAYVVTSKYADHLPLHRIVRILDRHGLDTERSTLWGWISKGAQVLEPLVQRMREKIVDGEVIHSDDTELPLQSKGKVHKARLWIYVGDPEHPYVYYDFRMNRSRAGPGEILDGYTGYVQVDAYAGYDVIFGPGAATEAGCWAHARRKFFDAAELGCARSKEAVERIKRLYEIEREGKGLSREDLVALRQSKSVPLLDELFEWMEQQQFQVLPESSVGKALAYAINNRQALRRYTEHGYLGIDNNISERGIRPVVIGRKNWLFTGSERGGKTAATIFSVIESAKRHGLEVFSYLRDVFTRLPGHPQSKIDDFLPDRWQAPHPLPEPVEADAASL